MKIVPWLNKDRIIMSMKSEEKREAIKELGSVIRQARAVLDYDKFMKEVFRREELCTTGIGNEIAIPHARTDGVKELIIAIGRSLKGIEFDAIDQKPVKLIFLLGTPQSAGLNVYLRVLAHLSRMLNNRAFRSELLEAKTPADIIKAFEANET